MDAFVTEAPPLCSSGRGVAALTPSQFAKFKELFFVEAPEVFEIISMDAVVRAILRYPVGSVQRKPMPKRKLLGAARNAHAT